MEAPRAMSENTYWQWVLDGMAGIINMTQALTDNNVKNTSAQQKKLEELTDRLVNYTVKHKDKQSDKQE